MVENTPNKSIQEKHAARIAAVQGIYGQGKLNAPAAKVVQTILAQWQEEAAQHEPEWDVNVQPDEGFLNKLVAGVMETAPALDDHIKAVLSEKWKLERINPVLLSLLRCAVFELRESTIPAAVVVDEYVGIADQLTDERDLDFVHGALHKIAETLRSNG